MSIPRDLPLAPRGDSHLDGPADTQLPADSVGGGEGSQPTIALVDPWPVVRAGIRAQVLQKTGHRPLWHTHCPAVAIATVTRQQPDLLLAEIQFVNHDGLDWLKQMGSLSRARIIIFTCLPAAIFAHRCRRCGAWAFLNKDAPLSVLFSTIRAVGNGRRCFPDEAAASGDAIDHRLAALSDRELVIFQLIGRGHSTKEIAALLARSPKTIETHRVNLMRKLGERSIASLMHLAIRWGETIPPPAK